MSIQNIGRNKWRVVVPRKGQKPIDRIINGSKQDAYDFEALYRTDNSGLASKMTLGAFLKLKWLPSLNIEPATHAEYTYGISYIEPHIGRIRLRDLTTEDIERAIHSLPEGSRRRKAKKVLSSGLKSAMRWRMLYDNPITNAEIVIGKGKTRAYQAYSVTELEEVLKVFRGCVAEPVVVVMAFCGLRKEEALALNWEDINLEAGVIEVRRAWVRSGAVVKEKETKTAGSKRSVYITGYGLARLQEIGDMRTGAIWPGKDHERVRPDAATRNFQRHIERASLRYVPLNHLRHTHATIALASGIDVALVSKSLGHSRISTTVDAYVKPLEQAKKGAAEVFASVVVPISQKYENQSTVSAGDTERFGSHELPETPKNTVQKRVKTGNLLIFGENHGKEKEA